MLVSSFQRARMIRPQCSTSATQIKSILPQLNAFYSIIQSQQSQFQDLESKHELSPTTSQPQHKLEASSQVIRYELALDFSPKLQSFELIPKLIDAILQNQHNQEQNNGSHLEKAQDFAIQNDKALKILSRYLNIEIENSKAQPEDQKQIRQYIRENMLQQQQDLSSQDLTIAKNEPRAQSYP